MTLHRFQNESYPNLTYIVENRFVSRKKKVTCTQPTKKMEMTFYICPSPWCLFFSHPKKKRNGKILGNSCRHKVQHLGYVNVVIKVPHISRMWLWWVWKNRRPKWMEINTFSFGGGMDEPRVPFVWGDQSWCKCMVIWGISVVIVHCLGWLYNDPWFGGMDD